MLLQALKCRTGSVGGRQRAKAELERDSCIRIPDMLSDIEIASLEITDTNEQILLCQV